jgi:tetratricopeptide (TPR) repeat protein
VGNKGIRTNLVIGQGEPKAGDIPLSSMETGKVEGFIGGRPQIDEPLIVDGIKRTQNALRHFQDRLDIHFGIVAIAERIERWDIVGDQIISILIVSKQNNNQWIWGPINSMSGDPKEFMIDNIMGRTAAMFESNTDVGEQAFLKVSQQLIDSYPDLIYGYANLGVLYLSRKQYDLARTYLLKAQKIDPSDRIVQANLKRLRREHH